MFPTEPLPWWVGLLFVIGGTLVSALLPTILPQKYHLVGFSAGALLVLIGAAVAFAHFPLARQWASVGIPKIVMAAGAAILVLGAAWFFATPHQVEGETSAGPPKMKTVSGGRFAPGQDVQLQDLLFAFEFPGDAALGSELVELGHLVTGTYAWFITMQNFDRRVSYNVIHIPQNARAENAALEILNKLENLRLGQTTSIERKYGEESPIVGEQLPFSDQIYIYHEPPLSEEQKKRIWQAYKEKGQLVKFRGPEYISAMWERYGPRQGE